MAKYVYPAIFTPEPEGYSIHFPDLESCYTSAPTLEAGMEMAADVLCLTLYGLEEGGKAIPAASDPRDVKTEKPAFVSLIRCDTLEYRRFYDSKAVKKTLTIPAWLNTMAERNGVNFSTVLQTALKHELNIQ